MALQDSPTLGQKAHDANQLAQRIREEVGNLGQTLFGPRPEVATDAPKRATQSVDDDVDEALSILRSTLPMLIGINQRATISPANTPGQYEETAKMASGGGYAVGPQTSPSRW